jgi:hypothetical protein
MNTYVAVDCEQLAEVLRRATPADVIHTAFPVDGQFPRLIVSGTCWITVSWGWANTNGRWRFSDGKLEHRPSPPEPENLKHPESRHG